MNVRDYRKCIKGSFIFPLTDKLAYNFCVNRVHSKH